ncbi:YqaE/Pmp3 family membrane protein [Bacteroides propionicifaciens]|jgi:uncharacterized membrane protein YqaE (UPF0057 family)|uniref:YqaE/Pmp3 family membrane protein n=1 Tax=Bacteroides propionicifaciens TaxID=392838 RepID=UPI00036C26F5|nr:YqaE/Pmp3 family membrane protein [Bacteroides propionicifaciens]
MLLIAILVPWLSFFMRGKIFAGLLCLILQITLIGWLPAAIWAVSSRVQARNRADVERLVRELNRQKTN